MLLIQSYKYRLLPKGEHKRKFRMFAGSCRYVYNKALELQKERYERGEKKLSYFDLARALTVWRNSEETQWLTDTPCATLRQALKDLERAYDGFFKKRTGFPKFKAKGMTQSVRFSEGIKLDQVNGRVFLPKIGWVRYINHRQAEGTPKNAAVTECCGKWYVSVQTEREVPVPTPKGGVVGIDLGIERFATLSDGTSYAPLNSFRRHEEALRKAQQSMSRKVKFSNNWKKAKRRVQKLHARIADVRRDYLHKISADITRKNAVVVVEDLTVQNMSKSAAGTVEQPGKNVRAKAGLNKSILDQGWYEFRRQLDYKMSWKGGRLIAVPPENTSRTCPRCGHVSADNRRTQAMFECVECGFQDNADVVGAINILSRGMDCMRDEGRDAGDASPGMLLKESTVSAQMACGSNRVGGRKQEPIDVTKSSHASDGLATVEIPRSGAGCQNVNQVPYAPG